MKTKLLYLIVILMTGILTAGAQDYKSSLNFGVGAMYGIGGYISSDYNAGISLKF